MFFLATFIRTARRLQVLKFRIVLIVFFISHSILRLISRNSCTKRLIIGCFQIPCAFIVSLVHCSTAVIFGLPAVSLPQLTQTNKGDFFLSQTEAALFGAYHLYYSYHRH